MESFHCIFVFRWIKPKFGVRGNFRLLISNLNSNAQYQFEILTKCHFSSLRSWFLAQHFLKNWLPWKQWMTCLQLFNFRRYYGWLSKNDISLLKISWTVFEIFGQNPRKPSTFSAVAFFTSKNQDDDDVIKNFYQFVKISTHNISLPSFIVIWLEIVKLGGGIPPSLFRLGKIPVQIRLKVSLMRGKQQLTDRQWIQTLFRYCFEACVEINLPPFNEFQAIIRILTGQNKRPLRLHVGSILQWTITLKEAPSILWNFYPWPFRLLTYLSALFLSIILGQENNCWPHKVDFVSINPISGGKCRNWLTVPLREGLTLWLDISKNRTASSVKVLYFA